MPSDPDPDPETINQLIERITVDAYGDEGQISFLCAFEDEIDYPITVTLTGTPASLDQVDYDGDAPRLVGVITNDDGQHRISLIELEPHDKHANQLLPAYRR
jgi:hypothetical protein